MACTVFVPSFVVSFRGIHNAQTPLPFLSSRRSFTVPCTMKIILKFMRRSPRARPLCIRCFRLARVFMEIITRTTVTIHRFPSSAMRGKLHSYLEGRRPPVPQDPQPTHGWATTRVCGGLSRSYTQTGPMGPLPAPQSWGKETSVSHETMH